MIFNRHVYRKDAEEGEDLAGGEVVDDKPKVEAGESGEPEYPPELLAKGEKMGWTPKDQFKGDPDKWRPLDEFVERGENMLPLVQAQVRRQDREISELKATVKDFTEHLSKTKQRAFDEALAHLKSEQAKAVAAADGAAFVRVGEQIDELKDQLRTETKPQPKQGEDAEFSDWLDRNRWANDPKLQAIGVAIREDLFEANPTMTRIELLDLTAKEVKKRFPEKFENPRRSAAPSVEGGTPPRKSGGKSYADLPAEARAACDRMARSGYSDKPKEMAEFKATYVKNYFESE